MIESIAFAIAVLGAVLLLILFAASVRSMPN